MFLLGPYLPTSYFLMGLHLFKENKTATVAPIVLALLDNYSVSCLHNETVFIYITEQTSKIQDSTALNIV